MCRLTVISWYTGRVLPVRPRITRYGHAGTNVPPPLTLDAVFDSGAMLNVGDANLPNLSYNMLFSPDAARTAQLGVLHRAGLLVVGQPSRVRWEPRDR